MAILITPKYLSSFYKKSIIFVFLSILGAVFNYLLFPVAARILNTREFGDFTTISALSNQILGIFLAFNVISIYLVKTNSEIEAREKSQVILKILIWLLAIITLLTIILSPVLKNKLQIVSGGGFLLLALIVLVSLPAIVWNGYLQGHKETDKVGLFALTSAVFKLIISAALLYLFGVAGGLLGISLGIVCGLIILFFSTKRNLPNLISVFSRIKPSDNKFVASISKYVIEAILVVGGLGFLQNIDILYAKSMFSPHTAGIYSGISTISNSVYYICFLLVWVLLPEIDINNSKNNKKVVGTAYKFLGIISLLVISAELLFSKLIVQIFLGNKFVGQSSLLVIATMFQIALVAITIYAYYLLVLRNRKSMLMAFMVIVPTIVFPLFFNKTPKILITTILFCVLGGFALFVLLDKVLNNRREYVPQKN
ncbi:MAG: hypothetical protein WCG30_00820 [Candidatus Saccharibacteria bacterium]